MTAPGRGEVWWAELEDTGRRPFLILTRDAAIPVLHSVLAAPITRTVRNIPSELALDEGDGMPEPCAASFDNLRVVPKWALTEKLSSLDVMRMSAACRAMAAAVDC